MGYWEKRAERLKLEQMAKAEHVNRELKNVYEYALQQLRKDVEDWYHRFALENNVSLADARRILDKRELKVFKMNLDDYRKQAKQLNLSKEHQKMLENASIRQRLTKNQEIYLNMAHHVEKLANTQNLAMSKLLSDVYEDSVYKTAYQTQRMKGEFSTYNQVPADAIQQAINKPWASDGKDFSSRIWENKEHLLNNLQVELTRSLMIQEGSSKLAERLAKRMNTSYNNARRLVETETAYIQERAALDVYDELDVEKYQILATLDSRTSDTCRRLDGKIFDRKDAKPGITMPPFHVYCRSTTVPYYDWLEDSGETRAARDENGKTTFVEGDLDYDSWYNKYVKNTDTDVLFGMVTSNGIKITALSKHQQKRADERQLDINGIRDALENPLHISDVKVDEKGNKSQRFIGRDITVNVNPDTGVVITSWKTGSKTRNKYIKDDEDD